MRNPSIFEPLFSLQEEELPTPPTHLIHSSSSEWLSSTYSASPCVDRAFSNNQLRKAPTTIFNQEMSTNQSTIKLRNGSALTTGPACQEKCDPIVCDHGKPSPTSTHILGRPMHSAPPNRSLSSSDVDKHDDGSVACKLLTSITKSISSPSLLSCCKESARETPYQKTLRLRMMKLQHCAEELGSESSDGALMYSSGGENSSFDSFSVKSSCNGSSQSSTKSLFARSLTSTIPQKDRMSELCDASPMMTSVRSAPNLGCPSLVSRHTSHMKERSFPPPLITHSLPRSPSYDSFACSLRAYREDGHFMIKEVKVPCRQYLQASRKDGRLTLQLINSDEGIEQENSAHKGLGDSQQADENAVDVCEGALNAASDKNEIVGLVSSGNYKVGVVSVNTVDVGSVVSKGSPEIDYLNMDEFEGKSSKLASISDVRKNGGLSAKRLLIPTLNSHNEGMADDVSHSGALGMPNNGAKRNVEKWLSPSLNLPNLSSTIPPPEHSPRLMVINPLIRLAQCEENMVLQSRSNRNISDTRVKKMLGLEISSASLQGAAFGTGRSVSSTIIFKDVGANSLMENVTKLVNSFALDGEKWCQGKVEYSSRELERSHGFKNDSSRFADGIRSINIGVKKVDESGTHTAKLNGVHILNVDCERKPRRMDAFMKGEGHGWVDSNAGGISTRSTTTTTLEFDVQLSLQLDWLQNLHCKERFDRNRFVNKLGFPCVAIRS